MKVVEKCKFEGNLNMKQQKIPFFFSFVEKVSVLLCAKSVTNTI